jgi:hypothetical protein
MQYQFTMILSFLERERDRYHDRSWPFLGVPGRFMSVSEHFMSLSERFMSVFDRFITLCGRFLSFIFIITGRTCLTDFLKTEF